MNTCIQAFDSLFTFHKVECIKLQILAKRNECKKYYTTHDANDETSRRATRCNGTEYRMCCQFAVIMRSSDDDHDGDEIMKYFFQKNCCCYADTARVGILFQSDFLSGKEPLTISDS